VRTSFRIEWDVVPGPVRGAIADALGSQVVEAVNQDGGFTPSLAARCRLADGRRTFLKAGSEATTSPFCLAMLRAEAKRCAQFPEGFPAPRLHHVHDDGEWVVLAFEEIVGRTPAQPWQGDELDRVVAALDRLPTPSALDLPSSGERLAGTFGGFAAIAADPHGVDDDWTLAHLDHLVDLESRWPEVADGASLVHFDVRADNVLLADDGRVLLVDWAHSFLGADWLDLLFALPSIELAGGPPCEEVLERSTRLRGADPDAVTTMAVALLGFFTHNGRLAPPPGAPAVRAYQEAQRRVARRWVKTRLGA
jgi:aminoglycoside phosphotransferase (APT) family kinase protein